MLPTNHFIKRYNWIFDISLLSLLFIIFYTFWLGKYPLFTPDEGRYSEIAREMIMTGDYITPRVNGVAFLDKPVLHYWLQVIAIKLFGLKEWSLRFFPVLFGIFGCLITYLCGRFLYNRQTGLLATIILATSPLYFGSAHYANLDLEVAILISSVLFLFLVATKIENPLRSLLFILAYFLAGCAVLTKGLIGIVLPMLIIGSWIILLKKWKTLREMHFFSGLFLFILIVLPWYFLVQKQNPQFFHYFFVVQQFKRFLSAEVFNNQSPFWFYLPVILVGFFPWTLFILQTLNKNFRLVWENKQTHQTELFLLLWISFIFVFFSVPHSKAITYILPLFPPLALLVGHYVSDCMDASKRNFYALSLGFCGLAFFFVFIVFLIQHFNWLDLSLHFNPFLATIALIFTFSGITAFLLRNRKTILPLFLTCTTCSILFLLTLVTGAIHLNQNTVKPLVVDLKLILKPEDEVMTYFKYYQDIPIYLGRRVTIATNWNSPDIAQNDNWARELWYGMPFQKTDDWLINEDKFWERWNSEKRVFVFLNANYFAHFKLRAKSYFHLGKFNDIILLSNKPTID